MTTQPGNPNPNPNPARLSPDGRKKYAEIRRDRAARHGRVTVAQWDVDGDATGQPVGRAVAALHQARMWQARTDRKPLYSTDSIWSRLGGSDGSTFAAYGETALRWFEKPESKGLRLVGLAHEIDKGIRHTGWFTDPDGWGESVAGVVYRLPGRNGIARYLAGYADPYNPRAVLLSLDIIEGESLDSSWDDDSGAIEAARAADGIAERMADQERDYQEGWQAGLAARDLAQEALRLGRVMVADCRDARALWRLRWSGLPGFPLPSIRAELRAAVAAVRDSRESYLEARREARDARDDKPGRSWRGHDRPALEGWNNAYGEGA